MTIDWAAVEGISAVLGLAGSGLVFFGTLAWKALTSFQSMQSSLAKLVANDLPHIYEEILEIRKDFRAYVTKEEEDGQDTPGIT